MNEIDHLSVVGNLSSLNRFVLWWYIHRFLLIYALFNHSFVIYSLAWWRHQMETFSALLTLCTGNSPVTGEFPSQRPVTRSFDVFTRGQFWPSGIVVACVCLSVCVSVCVCVRQSRACPCHKSSRVQASTIKFGQKVQKNLVKVPIVFGGDWSWPSRSNLTWKA